MISAPIFYFVFAFYLKLQSCTICNKHNSSYIYYAYSYCIIIKINTTTKYNINSFTNIT